MEQNIDATFKQYVSNLCIDNKTQDTNIIRHLVKYRAIADGIRGSNKEEEALAIYDKEILTLFNTKYHRKHYLKYSILTNLRLVLASQIMNMDISLDNNAILFNLCALIAITVYKVEGSPEEIYDASKIIECFKNTNNNKVVNLLNYLNNIVKPEFSHRDSTDAYKYINELYLPITKRSINRVFGNKNKIIQTIKIYIGLLRECNLDSSYNVLNIINDLKLVDVYDRYYCFIFRYNSEIDDIILDEYKSYNSLSNEIILYSFKTGCLKNIPEIEIKLDMKKIYKPIYDNANFKAITNILNKTTFKSLADEA